MKPINADKKKNQNTTFSFHVNRVIELLVTCFSSINGKYIHYLYNL